MVSCLFKPELSPPLYNSQVRKQVVIRHCLTSLPHILETGVWHRVWEGMVFVASSTTW